MKERGELAFQAQFAFLIRRFEQLKALDLGAQSQRTVVADFIFEKDKLFACLNLTDIELDTYNRYYNYFREQLPTPDLVIYLQATPEVLKKRLKKKNAAGEKAINEEYLEEVVKAYEHFFFHYTSSDLLIVNTSEIDFVDRNEDLQELLRKVSAPIKGTQYFLPLGRQRRPRIERPFRAKDRGIWLINYCESLTYASVANWLTPLFLQLEWSERYPKMWQALSAKAEGHWRTS